MRIQNAFKDFALILIPVISGAKIIVVFLCRGFAVALMFTEQHRSKKLQNPVLNHVKQYHVFSQNV